MSREKSYTARVNMIIDDEAEAEKGLKPMAEGGLTYRRLDYQQMTMLENKFFVQPLVELNKMAQDR